MTLDTVSAHKDIHPHHGKRFPVMYRIAGDHHGMIFVTFNAHEFETIEQQAEFESVVHCVTHDHFPVAFRVIDVNRPGESPWIEINSLSTQQSTVSA